jgi:hypothetical protein
VSEENKGNGASPEEAPQMSEEEYGQLLQVVAARFSPFTLHMSEEDMVKLASVLVPEQERMINTIMPQLLAPEDKPFWYFDLLNPRTKLAMRMNGLKNLSKIGEVPDEHRMQAAMNHAFLIAMLTDGVTARAALRAHGFGYTFGVLEKKNVSQKIIMPGT